jgi:two-component sensor histidine kinase
VAETPASALILAEFIHRAANDFATACAEVNFAAAMSTHSAVQERLIKVVARLHALATIQRLLLPPREPLIDLGNRLCELCHYQAEARFAAQGAFIRLRTCEVMVDAGRGWILLMIVSELLTNAARHAFNGPGGVVQVEIRRTGDTILCEVSDDGAGIRSAKGRRGTGTAIVEELARGANIDFVSLPRHCGTGFELRLPYAQG